MSVQPVTVNLPTILYSRLRRRAEQSRHTVEAELLEVVTTAVPVADDLPADLSEAISPLSLLNDAALAGLVRQYERVMLVRAQAAALLKQRGQDVSELLTA